MNIRPEVRKSGSPEVSWSRIIVAMTLGLALGLAQVGCGRAAPETMEPAKDPANPAPQDDALALAQRVVAHHGMAANLTAQLLLRVKPAGLDAQIATVNLWSPADGRTRLSVTRVGFSGIEGLIATDGGLLAFTRDGVVVRDDLRVAFADELGADAQPQRLIEDLKAGPLPLAAAFTRTATGLACIDPGTGLQVEVELAADGLTVSRKRWLRSEGEEVLRLDYAREQRFDGLLRAASWVVTIPGVDAQIQLRIQEIDVVPQIGEARLALDVPAGEAVDIAGFLSRAAAD